MLTIGIGLIATGSAPRWGKIVAVMGVLVAWARVYLGLHFPLDMLTSALIASLFAAVSVLLVAPSRRWIMPLANRLYDGALDVMRLPGRVFPRLERPD